MEKRSIAEILGQEFESVLSIVIWETGYNAYMER